MSRLRHAVVVVVSALPLLGAVLFATWRLGPTATVAAAVLWTLGVLALGGAVWRETVRPLYDLLDELGTRSGHIARWRVRELREDLETIRAEKGAGASLLEDLTASLGEGLLVVDSELRLRLMNPVAGRFCGFRQVRPGTMLVEVLREPAALEVITRAARGEQPPSALINNPRGVWEVRAFPVRPAGAVALLTDITVVHRSSELRRRFVQDLAHELRAPLTVLRTTVEALEEEVETRTAEVLVRQVERITRLAEELQELASIEAGDLKLHPERLQLSELLEEIVDDARPVAESRGIGVQLEVPRGLEVVGDRRALTRVLGNLLDNAVKYNRPGGGIEVTATPVAAGVQVVVADSGLGIPAADLGAVFQRFYRVDRARTPGAGGLGLGLAIVKHLVQRMGGTITLDSREGVGTRAILKVPQGEATSGDRTSEAS